MRGLFLLIALTLGLSVQAQKVDYMEMRDTLAFLNCRGTSKDTVDLTIKNLEKLDVNSIDTNLAQCYYDLGMAYYYKASWTEEEKWQEKSDIASWKSLFLDSDNPSANWNLALRYSQTNECELAKKLLEQYLETCPREYWMLDQIELIKDRCN